MDSKITSNDGDQTLHSEAGEADSLLNAIGTMNYEKARNLLKEGSNPNDPNIKSTYGKALLHIAVEKGDKESVGILLEHGARINEIDNFGRTALHYSVMYEWPEICRLLLAESRDNSNIADSNITDDADQTYLFYLREGEELDNYCITSNSTELTKDSTEQVQEILDPKFILGSRFLDLVARSKLNEVKTFLHEEPDIDINSKDKEGRTALQIAQENGNDEMFFFLSGIKGVDTSFLDAKSEKEGANTGVLDTELEEGYIYSEEEGTESEEEGAKANTSDRKTTQTQDDKNGSSTQDQNLMDSKITPDDRNQTLHSEADKVHYLPNAILAKNHQEVISLLEGGIDPNEPTIRSRCGTTPLHIAVEKCDKELVDILLKHRARIDEIDSLGQTALHCAAIKKQYEICQILLERGANPDIVDLCGRRYSYHLEEGKKLEDYRTNSNSTESTESPSTNPTNPKEEEQLVTKNQANGSKRSFSAI